MVFYHLASGPRHAWTIFVILLLFYRFARTFFHPTQQGVASNLHGFMFGVKNTTLFNPQSVHPTNNSLPMATIIW